MTGLNLKNGLVQFGIGALSLILIAIAFAASFETAFCLSLPLSLVSLSFMAAGTLNIVIGRFGLKGIKGTIVTAILIAIFAFFILLFVLLCIQLTKETYCQKTPYRFGPLCATTAPDAGKTCAKGSECVSSVCILEKETDAIGRCGGQIPTLGCHWVSDSNGRHYQCAD